MFEPWLRHTHPPSPRISLENKNKNDDDEEEDDILLNEENSSSKEPAIPMATGRVGLNSVTETVARKWCREMYGIREAESMAEQLAKTNHSIVRSGTLWKAVASGDGHYLRSIMGHTLPMEWFESRPPRATLLYRASRDGWRVQNFHSKCDGKGATLTAIKTANGCVFGGFSDVTWDSQGRNTTSSKAWLFSIKSLAGTPPTKMPIKPSARTYATFRAGNYGPTFGGGHDLYIADNANMCTSSYSNLGHTYAIPPGQGTTGSVKAQTFLAGTYNFTPVELEVYSISEGL
ncbi:TLD domain-containing protein [bacterium]|nr:TLD domain-containing protein [bacterium]